jgi:hypothetical protein
LVIRRLVSYRGTFDDDDPVVFILAPDAARPVPAGDTRRGTAWLFRTRAGALAFNAFLFDRHGLEAVPVAVKLRQLARALAARDLTFVRDPEPRAGYGDPFAFKTPQEN